ncbi:MAG: hypothetical protein MH825_03235 [Cyanobacteria bacterium]|nr:hypothetical protein [Cyanobacteriota bacterium]
MDSENLSSNLDPSEAEASRTPGVDRAADRAVDRAIAAIPVGELEAEVQGRSREAYLRGRDAFERGRYRDAIAQFDQARRGVMPNSPLGGEIQVWTVMTREALGDREVALEQCRALCKHPQLDTRKQAKRLLVILEAPQLARRPEWLTAIPDLSKLEDGSGDRFAASKIPPPKPKPPENPWLNPPPPPADAVTFDGRGLWLALAIAIALMGIWAAVG